ncbi:MAG TPA: twin-arginine translocation signal domain-containing protein [Thioploca sp.]|nr:twin-arginine translocation signal domain-containing protein [Thioploca sp.]
MSEEDWKGNIDSRKMSRRRFIKGTTAAGVALTLVGIDPNSGTFKAAFAKGASKPEKWFLSVCPYCGVGCGVEVGVASGKVVAVKGMKDHPVNKGRLCILGKNLVDILYTNDRALYPMTRRGERFNRIGWNEATDRVANQLKQTIDRYGPNSVAMYISASEYNEEYYIYNKFVKGCLGTNNLESSARLCWASGVVGLVKAFGADAPPCAYDDVEKADLFFMTGYNVYSSKPVFFRRIIKAKYRNNTKLIVVDPRNTNTADFADRHLRIKPGTDVILHNTLANILIQEKLINEREARQLTENYDAFKQHVNKFTAAMASEATGLSVTEIVETARDIGRAKAGLFLWGQGLNQSNIGTRKVTSLLNIVFITGNIGKPGAGPMAITGQTGAMGLREVGGLPHLLPGFRKVTDDKARDEIAKIWGVDPNRMDSANGKTLPAILEGIDKGQIKALWIIHSNPAATFPDSNWVRKVLSKTEFLVVQDCYHPTETSKYAHLILPGAQWSEKAGILTNSERGLNLVEQAVMPPGEAKPDLEIVMDVAKKMGFSQQFPYNNTEEIFEEYKRCCQGRPCDISGITYNRLRIDKGIQWPVPALDHQGTKRRFLDKKFPKGKLRLNLHEHQEAAEVPDKNYPILLMTGLVFGQYHSRTRTSKVPALNRAVSEAFAEINPSDARKYRLWDGEMVKVSSKRGTVTVRAKVTDSVMAGTVFLPYHFAYLAGKDKAINSLTNRAFDEFSQQPEYKACAVKIERT